MPTIDMQDTTQRKITMILYLNTPWTKEDGGTLRLYKKDDIIQEIVPLAGRIVLFLFGVFSYNLCIRAGMMDHSVQPTLKERFAITSWIK